jgi:hypothetical protein
VVGEDKKRAGPVLECRLFARVPREEATAGWHLPEIALDIGSGCVLAEVKAEGAL